MPSGVPEKVLQNIEKSLATPVDENHRVHWLMLPQDNMDVSSLRTRIPAARRRTTHKDKPTGRCSKRVELNEFYGTELGIHRPVDDEDQLRKERSVGKLRTYPNRCSMKRA